MENLFDLKKQARLDAQKHLFEQLENYYEGLHSLPVAPSLNKLNIQKAIQSDFASTLNITDAIDHVINGLKKHTVHAPHPGYYGLFNPRSNYPGILADIITATFNPQLAAWSHAPFANEVEKILIGEFGKKFGYDSSLCDGVFTSGGAEANLTALLAALNHCFSSYASEGIIAQKAKPTIYVSYEAHHSLVKAASITGLGLNAIRKIPLNSNLKMDTNQLRLQIIEDIQNNYKPVMIVATLGTTGTGAIDDIEELKEIALAYSVWLHADAAYGGAIMLTREYRKMLIGISGADSITFDAHKWMSVPMSASLFLTRHPDILHKTFRVVTDYMPKEGSDLDITDPYAHSIQWSRRFIGLKIYLSLLVFGWDGYRVIIERHIRLGKLLKKTLLNAGWKIYNSTELPVICFGKQSFESDNTAAINICSKIIATGKAWLSVYKIGEIICLRACITNYATSEKNIFELVHILNQIADSDEL